MTIILRIKMLCKPHGINQDTLILVSFPASKQAALEHTMKCSADDFFLNFLKPLEVVEITVVVPVL